MNRDIPRLTLTDFVNVVMKSGTPKATAVASIKNRDAYSPKKDFYKPLRERIVEVHRQGLPRVDLRRFLGTLTDEKKQVNYPPAVEGYIRWWGRSALTWFAPPSSVLYRNGVELSVTPEVGLLRNDRSYVIKLHLTAETLARNRADIISHAMKRALEDPESSHVLFGVLDVRRSRLQEPSQRTPEDLLDALLDAEFAYIASLWPRV